MVARDPHRFINELDELALDRLVARLESRAQDAVFARLLDKYATQLMASLPPSASILEVGCGTGAVLRHLARRGDFTGQALGIDHCASFVDAAASFARAENASDRIAFQLCDAHSLDFPSASFDAVIAHTLISHVTDPAMVLGEMARVVRPGGTVVIFDGDYASLTYGFPDHGFGHQMDVALATATFNNPRIMRDLPRIFPRMGLNLKHAWGDAVTEIGHGNFFRSFAETYAPYVKQASLLPAQAVDVWLFEQKKAMESGTFFAACNYYTYFASRAD